MDRRNFIYGIGTLAASGTLPAPAFASPLSRTPRPVVRIFGIGGAGGSIVSRLMTTDVAGINEYICIDADKQSLDRCQAHKKILLNGEQPHPLKDASQLAIASQEEVAEVRASVTGADVVIVVAGFSGETGTNIAPLVAWHGRRSGAHVAALVVAPFPVEDMQRIFKADGGIQKTQLNAHIAMTISNEAIAASLGDQATMAEIFAASENAAQQSIQALLTLMVNGPGILDGVSAMAGQSDLEAFGGILHRVINRRSHQLRLQLGDMENEIIALREMGPLVERTRKAHFQAADALHGAQAKLYAAFTKSRSRRAGDLPGPRVELDEEVELVNRRNALEATARELRELETRWSELTEKLEHTRQNVSWHSEYLESMLVEARQAVREGTTGSNLAAAVADAEALLADANIGIGNALAIGKPMLARQPFDLSSPEA